MDQRPISGSRRRGQLNGLLAARATAEATSQADRRRGLSPRPARSWRDHLGPSSEQTGDLLTYLLTCPLANP
jgi:hypothetical protein